MGVIIKSLLVITAVVLVSLLIAGGVLLLDWPWWTGFFFALLLTGLAIGVFLLRKAMRRRKEQQFVDQIISQDDIRLKDMADKDKEESQLLQARWKEAIDTLKHSHLRKFGNPLYVLPWYLVIGESASGKTTAIKSARLSSPFAESTQISGLSGTRNCDWWFFEQAIIIDTAGRYAIPVDESHDKDEWRSFLSLLAKYRKKEALNGLIVTIAADKLLGSSAEALQTQGLQIRARIDELMLSLGTKFPVYVLVSKCDLIKGMTQFCDKLPENAVKQAMGMVTPRTDKVSAVFWRQAIDTVSERLNNLLLRVLHDSRAGKIDPALILFPCEFARMRSGLDSFMGKAFQENPYQETPILRGLFFTSGRQEGTPYSHFLQKLGLLDDTEVLAGTNKGMFLHDFFAKILPMDRGIFAPTRRVLEWQRLSRNLGLTSWVVLIIALCGLMSFSFVKNLSTMREVPKEFLQAPVLQGDLLMDVVTLDQYQQAILKVEERNRNWWIPRFGLNESMEAEERLKEKFTRQFRQTFLHPLDGRMAERMAGFTLATEDRTISRHVSHLVRRINLLSHRLKSSDLQGLFELPRVPFLVTLSPEQLYVIPEIRKKMADMYLYYLVWNRDDSQINLEMNELQAWLKQSLALKGNQLDWLIAWGNEQDGISPVTLRDFWGGSRSVEEGVMVAPAFTKNGKAAIDSFLLELEAALPDPGPILITRAKIEFAEMYRNSFMDAWHGFAAGFAKGSQNLSGYGEWLPMAQKITGLSGPYFALLDRMIAELGSVDRAKEEPSWVVLISLYQSTRAQAAVLARSQKGSLLSKAGQKSKHLFGRLGDKLDRAGVESSLDNQLQAAKALLEYQKALGEIMVLLVPRKAAYDTAAAVFNGEKNSFSTAKQASTGIKTYLTSGKEDEAVFWDLMNGPIDFLWEFERIEAACYLQDQWDKEVLVEIQGIGDQQKVLQLLLDQDGYAMQFIKGPAAPFLSRKPKKGYYGVTALGGSLPLEPGFFSFLTRGVSAKRTVRPYYDVSIKGLPTGVNSEAQIKPHATHIEMQCANETLKLSNFQFPISKNFHWSRETCGDVLFEIEVSDMVLVKQYRGSQAFPRFLNDFKTGRKRFYPKDFPEHRNALQRLGIKYINVNYQFAGQKPVLRLLRAAPGRVPTRIAKCWD
ncbi:MAG: type VI secretion protein IcmF/TssM N-terminal domain-containing protein [Thermodesulfobacteriota bacterium]|nr:type VI secretion protein IcmF/TssM N-terminal domain-containing protein [Thermodesulfobacteriota bacterium]